MSNTSLSQPLTLPCGVTLSNRLSKSAMTEAMANKHDAPTEKHINLYRRWAKGGLAVQVTGNVMIDRRFLERPGNVVVEDERDITALSKWAEAAKSERTQAWVQISHPGRQCPMVVNARPLSPSNEKLKMLGLFGKPRAMRDTDINDAIRRYAETARILQKAGFDGVQIHGAHGYLISQFLSPITNHRTDYWGGSLENRARFLRRVVAAVRRAVGPSFPVGVKLNSADFQKGGFTLEDCKQVARWLQEDSIDLLEISGGTYEEMSFATATPDAPQRDSTKAREAFFLDYAREIRAEVTIPIMVTGGFRSRAAMQQALIEDGIDMIGLARPLCVHPDGAADLINGGTDRIGISEDGLTLGTGTWGVNAQNWLINLTNTVARVEYYVWQMDRMAAAREPSKRETKNALGLMLGYLGKSMFRAMIRKPFARRSKTNTA
ncbi:NADH:flavin oxidoreductase/NADH oxidase family protein [Shimia abyssi]|uniref:2,4-dienoyl-CoA reductase-like NADH-dependent reductase (Old Yellow Enzyme family) n=1 Tax=Shimia abyssi TaxID=1662395 RepID=A0A2P8FKS7_9RHOB|nr:NADH:flavin oxidoreductase/NADH oxidase family protein [Shimia abyssi]PSL22285.1 2,4-dienoyl-CoA reductase-like NADH-dependent reductase (Old Yellow Enzyme family) [Shimia abyssi]